ncbi:MAG: hypothetical protein ACK5G7_00720, partial [Erysipelotrichaceae bacterium]
MCKILDLKAVIGTLVIMLVGLSGCSSKGEVITYWNSMTGPDGEYMQTIVDQFNEENKGVYYVEESVIPNEDLYTKLNMKGSDDNLPDLIVGDDTRIPQLVEGDIILPLDEQEEMMNL